ncbi:SEVEN TRANSMEMBRANE PROTEIN 1 [Salix viminalis]|uniref:SEVEN TRANSMEMBRANE PROTEIN 1 n=1 Tax=Salix viminalis TaxID=40686 RepID=A0A9Q0V418_SALVM|nr:SEVEN TRANSMEMBRANE PROTEIN 1 [Salix viminalis]
MAFFKSTMPICPHHCSQWARVYMKYCLCSVKDGVSLTLGMISVLSWGVAEVPQIVTNYKKKSTEGLSLAFLLTWIIGDIFNVFGCMLEPATLPTQYYMAVLYTMTSTLLTAQTVYYGHIYHRLKSNRRRLKGPVSSHSEEAGRIKQGNSSDAGAQVNSADKQINESATPDGTNGLSSPIPFPTLPQKSSPERDLYYASARSLSRSHAPTVGSFLAQRMTPPSFSIRNSIEEPLLGEDVAMQSAQNSNTKTMLCVVSVVTFLGTLNLHHSANSRLGRVFENKHQGIFIQVGRKILQTSSILSHENDNDGSGIGTFLGWSMAAIYMGGRLPQICLNIKRGKVEGLNPLMFVFALVGNITYVASILVNSLAWSKIRANQPWLVDAGGCALLDTCILLQFVYFRYSRRQAVEEKLQSSNGA